MGKYREYTNEDIITYSKEVKSIAGLLKKLDLRIAGGNYTNIKRLLQKLNVDCSHWTGSAWSKDQQLKDWSDYTRVEQLKPHLLKDKGNTCNSCKLDSWMDKPIPLEVHHLDGDRTNNDYINLELLCCNCHALTHNWRGKKSIEN